MLNLQGIYKNIGEGFWVFLVFKVLLKIKTCWIKTNV